MKKTKRILLFIGMLCAFLLLSSCDKNDSEINISLESDYSGIAAAIRSMNTSLADKLSAIESALSDGLCGNREALALIQKSLESLGGTAEEKLAAIGAAVKAQTTSLEMKLALIEAAVTGGFADAKAQQELIRQALETLGGTAKEKLAAIEAAVKAQASSLETKLGMIEAAVTEGLADSKAAQEMIKEAVEMLGDTLEEKVAAIEQAIRSQTGDLSAKLALIETAVKEGFAEGKGQDALIQEALESLTGTTEEKLAALEEAVQGQTSSLETKLGLIESAVTSGLADGNAQLALIQKAVASLGGDLDDQLSAIESAIGSQTTSLQTKLGLIEAALQGDNGDSAKKLELIQQALDSLGGTLDDKLAAIDTLIASQTSTLEAKLDLIDAAVRKGLANEVDAQTLIKKAIETLGGKLDDKLAAIDSLIGDQTKCLELKLQAIADADSTGFSNSEAVQEKIQEAIKSLSGTLEDKLAVIDTVLNKQTTSLAEQLGLIEGAVRQGFINSAKAQEFIRKALAKLNGTPTDKLAAIQGAITAQTTTLAGKLEAIEGALSAGFLKEKDALILIKTAVASIATNVSGMDTTLANKVSDVVNALGTLSTTLSSDQISQALADILKAVQVIKDRDYSEVLAAIQTALGDLKYPHPKELSIWYHPNVSFKVKYNVEIPDGARIERDSLCSVNIALDKTENGRFDIKDLESVKFLPASDTTAPLTTSFDQSKHYVRLHPDTTGSVVWRAFQCSTGTKNMDVKGHLALSSRQGISDTIDVAMSWYNTVWYVQELWARVSEIGDATTAGSHGSFEIDASDILSDCGLDEDKMIGCRCELIDDKFSCNLTGYKKMDARFLPGTRVLEFNLKDNYDDNDDFSVDGFITLLILPSENDPSIKPQQLQINFRYILHITP